MGHRPKDDQWVWVLIQDPGNNEQIIGQHDAAGDISFIPAFLDKETALKCHHLLVRELGSG